MLCQTPQPLAHSTRFLSQQRNILTTWVFHTFPVLLFVYFNISHLLVSSFPPICPSQLLFLSLHLQTLCLLFPPVLFKWERCASAVIGLSVSPSFLNCSLSEKVGFLLCARTQVYSFYGESISKKANCECRQLYRASPVLWQNSRHSMIQKHILGEWHQLALFSDLYSTFVSSWHPLLHTALTALIYTESNPLRCVYKTTIFLFYE